jgi:hypothetical protein
MANLTDRIKLLVDWWPLVLLLQRIAAAKPGQPQAAAVVESLLFLASKTEIEVDDKLCDHLRKLIATKEGGELVDYVASLVGRPSGV